MKKILLALVSVFTLATFVPVVAGAQGINKEFCDTPGAANTAVCKDVRGSQNSNPLLGPDGILTVTARILSFVVGFAALVAIILSGIRYILSGGDSGKVEQAKNSIIYGVIGLVVALVAQAIVALVISNL